MPHWRGVSNNCRIAIIAVWITEVWFLKWKQVNERLEWWCIDCCVCELIVSNIKFSIQTSFYCLFSFLSIRLFVCSSAELSVHPAKFNYKSLNPLGEGYVEVGWVFSLDKPRTISAPLSEHPTILSARVAGCVIRRCHKRAVLFEWSFLFLPHWLCSCSVTVEVDSSQSQHCHTYAKY